MQGVNHKRNLGRRDVRRGRGIWESPQSLFSFSANPKLPYRVKTFNEKNKIKQRMSQHAMHCENKYRFRKHLFQF